jgi:two-component system sensor histidine kinase CpxA
MLYAQTAVTLLERFGPGALDQFLKTTGENTLLKLRLDATNPGAPCTTPAPPVTVEAGLATAAGDETTSISSKGLDGDYCLTVHAKAGGLPESAQNRRSRLQIAILFEMLSCAALSYLIARYIARPISELKRAAAGLARGDLSARVGLKFASRTDEAADLVREFDQMAERVSDLIEKQRRLIGDISHEIKSPLARLSVALGLARRSAEDLDPKQFARMQREIEKISLLVSELLTLAQMEQPNMRIEGEPIDLSALVERVVADAAYEAQNRAADVTFRGPSGPIEVHGNESLMRRAIENVVRNAIFYTSSGIKIDVAVFRKDPNWAGIEIADRGPGVPDSALQHLFEPFYRVDEARDRRTGGTGIGLAICERAIRLHGGVVSARNATPHGLVVEIGIPLQQPA